MSNTKRYMVVISGSLLVLILGLLFFLLKSGGTCVLEGHLKHPTVPRETFDKEHLIVYDLQSDEEIRSVADARKEMLNDAQFLFRDFLEVVRARKIVQENKVIIRKGFYCTRILKGTKLIVYSSKDINWAEIIVLNEDTVLDLDGSNCLGRY